MVRWIVAGVGSDMYNMLIYTDYFYIGVDKFESIQYSTRLTDAGWSSLVARRAHNPKVVGSNPAPATNSKSPFIGAF